MAPNLQPPGRLTIDTHLRYHHGLYPSRDGICDYFVFDPQSPTGATLGRGCFE
jgi:hypothetical protein